MTGGLTVDIDHNVVESTDGYMTAGIDIEPNPGWTVSDVAIRRNTVRKGSIAANGEAGVVSRVRISTNVVDGNPIAGAGAAIDIRNVPDVVIERNVAEGYVVNPVIKLWHSNNCVVSANQLKQNGTDQITYPDSVAVLLDNSSHCRITGNIVTARAMTAGAGIKGTHGSECNAVTSNMFHNVRVRYDAVGWQRSCDSR